MVVHIRLNKEEKALAMSYAKSKGLSLSMAMKRAFFDKVQDEYDQVLIDHTLREYEKNHESYSHDEVKRMLSL